MISEKAATSNKTRQFYEFGPFRLDPREKLLLRNGERIPITLKALDTLLVLVEQHGHIVEKTELMQRIWPDSVVEENNLTQNISAIRKALGANGQDQQFIETLPRRGYRFIGEVREVQDEPILPAAIVSKPVSRPEIPNASLPKRSPTILLSAVIAVLGVLLILYFSITRKDPTPPPDQKLKMLRLASTSQAWETAISPDGSMVAYITRDAGRQSLWLRQVETGTVQELLANENMRFRGLTFSPDGKSLYYAQQQPSIPEYVLYQKSIQGDARVRLLAGVDSSITFSPDGKKIAFVRESKATSQSSLVIANVDGSGERTLSTRKMPKYYAVEGLSWSPDGKLLAVAATDTAPKFHFRILTVRVDTGQEIPIGDAPWDWAEKIVWVNERQLVAIGRERESGNNNKQLWLVDYPGGQSRKVLTTLSDFRGLSVSKDGQKLVTVRSETRADLWLVPNSDSNLAHAITGDPASQIGSDGIDWTLDNRVIYTSLASGYKNLWIMNADGTQAKPLTTEAQDNAANPTVTSDGRQVVFNSGRAGFARIWSIDLEGQSPTELSHGALDLNPYSSPQERMVFFSQYIAEKRQVLRLRMDGNESAQPLTDKIADYPVVSPDGKWVACHYQETPASPQRIAIISVTGGTPVQLLNLEVFPLSSLRWHPDGKAITYLTSEDGAMNIWQQPLAGGSPQRVTNFKSDRIFSYAWSRDGRTLACSRGITNREVVMISNWGK